jgi:drug/metabolite transporter (DMT)-like permease
MLLILIAAGCYGLSGVYMRRYLSTTSYSSVALSTGQIVAGALELAMVLPFATHLPHALPARVVLAIFALGAFGTGIAYVLMYALIRLSGATAASTVTYFIPVVSIAIGVVGLGEQLTWNAPVGALVIVAGALLSRSGPAAARPHATPAHAPDEPARARG